MPFTGPISDQLAIRALHDTYADAVFRRDASAWAALWADDAQWDLMGMAVSGRDAIGSTWSGAMANYAFVAFFSQPGAIEITGDAASGRVYTNEVLEGLDGSVARPVGQYDDIYVRRDTHWLYQRRIFRILKG
jgi:uncharacterized protein (TIGR02246 family)